MKQLKAIQRFLPDLGRTEGGLAAYATALVGGALLGGIALALLNRKTIQSLQKELHTLPTPPTDEIY